MLGWCSHLKGAWWGRSRDRVSVLFLLWVMITWLCSVCELLWSFTIMICAIHTFLYVHYYSVKPWVEKGGKKSRAIWIQTEKKQNYLNLKQFPLSEVRLSMNPTPNIRSSSQYAFYYFISTGLPFNGTSTFFIEKPYFLWRGDFGDIDPNMSCTWVPFKHTKTQSPFNIKLSIICVLKKN